jgi:hypothetical protein
MMKMIHRRGAGSPAESSLCSFCFLCALLSRLCSQGISASEIEALALELAGVARVLIDIVLRDSFALREYSENTFDFRTRLLFLRANTRWENFRNYRDPYSKVGIIVSHSSDT